MRKFSKQECDSRCACNHPKPHISKDKNNRFITCNFATISNFSQIFPLVHKSKIIKTLKNENCGKNIKILTKLTFFVTSEMSLTKGLKQY